MTDQSQIVICCRSCGQVLSDWLRPAPPEILAAIRAELRPDGEELLPPGVYARTSEILQGDELFYGVENSDIVLSLKSLVGVSPSGTREGCCGADGQDGPNLSCKNGHPIATELADCWQPHLCHILTSPEDSPKIQTDRRFPWP